LFCGEEVGKDFAKRVCECRACKYVESARIAAKIAGVRD
jgi:hypothetical protein